MFWSIKEISFIFPTLSVKRLCVCVCVCVYSATLKNYKTTSFSLW